MGLSLIAGILEKAGHTVNIIDADALKMSRAEAAAIAGKADVVGLTAMTPMINTALDIARRIKENDPAMPVILGGAHATIMPEDTMSRAPQIDIIVKGEGEDTIIELLGAMESGRSIDGVPGIIFRKNGELLASSERKTRVDLESLPFLAYHLLPWERYKPHPPHGRALPFAGIITSRGCPYRCAYCSKPIFGKKFRAQSPERVLDEIAYHRDRFGVREIAFYDDVLTLDKKRARALAEGLFERGIDIDWTCETRVDLVDAELLRQMKRAGCYAIAYGLESASQEILNNITKDITIEQAEEAVRHTREAGIQTIGYFMIGSPGETPETIQKTIDFARKLKLDFAQFSITTPFPGTALFDMMQSSPQPVGMSWDDFLYAGAGTGTTPVFETDTLSRNDLQNWEKRAYRQFYLRPSYFVQRMSRIRSPGDIKVTLKGFYMFLGNICGGD